jgi:hypothetical protein
MRMKGFEIHFETRIKDRILNASMQRKEMRMSFPPAQATDGRPRELKTPTPRSGRKNGGTRTSCKTSHSRLIRLLFPEYREFIDRSRRRTTDTASRVWSIPFI